MTVCFLFCIQASYHVTVVIHYLYIMLLLLFLCADKNKGRKKGKGRKNKHKSKSKDKEDSNNIDNVIKSESFDQPLRFGEPVSFVESFLSNLTSVSPT